MSEAFPYDPKMVEAILEGYETLFPEEHDGLSELRGLMAHGLPLNNRKTMPGHITASAFILSPNRQKILLVHHLALQKWLQPGGHWDPGDPTPLHASEREAIEETNVRLAKYLPLFATHPLVPFDIDSHRIPANDAKSEPEHTHHDMRYMFLAESVELEHEAAAVSGAEWVAMDDERAVSLLAEAPKLKQILGLPS